MKIESLIGDNWSSCEKKYDRDRASLITSPRPEGTGGGERERARCTRGISFSVISSLIR